MGRRSWFLMTPEICLAPYFGVNPFRARCFFASSVIVNSIPCCVNASSSVFICISKIRTMLASLIGAKGTISVSLAKNSGRKYFAMISISLLGVGTSPAFTWLVIHSLPIFEVKMITEFEKSPSFPSRSCIWPSSSI